MKAYAKINLNLKVLGIRPDSYHELFTLMQTVDLYDILEFSPSNKLELTVELAKDLSGQNASLSAGSDNLAYRAADLLRMHTGFTQGVRINLIKKIPLAAGLAGGSADAAAVLKGLNSFWNLNLPETELAQLGAQLGSDVPFCLRGGTALARNRGETIEPLADLHNFGVLLAKPDFGLSTALVYRLYDKAKINKHSSNSTLPATVNKEILYGQNNLKELADYLENDLEQAVLPLYPEINALKETIASLGAAGVLMSGSGPTVFGLFANKTQAEQAAGKLQIEGSWTWATEFAQAKK